jgi:hypothetical protein
MKSIRQSRNGAEPDLRRGISCSGRGTVMLVASLLYWSIILLAGAWFFTEKKGLLVAAGLLLPVWLAMRILAQRPPRKLRP